MLVTGHTTAACWGNCSRVASYCETSVLPSGKSNISLVCQQDRYFPNRLWEAAAQLFLPWDHERGAPMSLEWYKLGGEKGSRSVASLSPCVGAETLKQLHGAAPGGD